MIPSRIRAMDSSIRNPWIYANIALPSVPSLGLCSQDSIWEVSLHAFCPPVASTNGQHLPWEYEQSSSKTDGCRSPMSHCQVAISLLASLGSSSGLSFLLSHSPDDWQVTMPLVPWQPGLGTVPECHCLTPIRSLRTSKTSLLYKWTWTLTPNKEAIFNWHLLTREKLVFSKWSLTMYISHT